MRYAISDIHGCAATLRLLVESVIQPSKGDSIHFLGDYIDRGPDAKGVIDYIFLLQEQGLAVTALKGNHEDMIEKAFANPDYFSMWIASGGANTLRSFNIKDLAEMPSEYQSFFRSLEYYKELPDYYLVHAGFNINDKDPFSDIHSMLWTRAFKPAGVFCGKKVIHGHTPRPLPEIIESVEMNQPVVNIDGGCVYKGRLGMGNLVALNLDTLEVLSQPFAG